MKKNAFILGVNKIVELEEELSYTSFTRIQSTVKMIIFELI